jgi:hypothetical protein
MEEEVMEAAETEVVVEAVAEVVDMTMMHLIVDDNND